VEERYGFGVPDEEFERGAAPMTKFEVRAVTVAKARLSASSRVLDVGAGTGALAVDAARVCTAGEVVAIERSAEALRLLRANAERLASGNVRVVAGEAPEAMRSVDGPFDAVLVGGSGGQLAQVLDAAAELMRPGGRVVVNAIGLGTLQSALAALGAEPWAGVECVQVSVSRAEAIGSDLRFVPLNPVWIVSATLAAPDGEAGR
jgi:cobalt-precorrin-6B (C15)-methyltransferase